MSHNGYVKNILRGMLCKRVRREAPHMAAMLQRDTAA